MLIFVFKYSPYYPLKSCFSGCKSIGFGLQKMMFYSPKAMLLQPKTYAFRKSMLVFVKINAYFSRRIEMLIVWKREKFYTFYLRFLIPKSIKLSNKSIHVIHRDKKSESRKVNKPAPISYQVESMI